MLILLRIRVGDKSFTIIQNYFITSIRRTLGNYGLQGRALRSRGNPDQDNTNLGDIQAHPRTIRSRGLCR